jgi:hypothetical protein
MSAKVEKRRMPTCWRINADRNVAPPGKVQITVGGSTAKGNPAEFIFDMAFHQWICVARQFSEAWKVERASRLAEIDRIDAGLPKEES